MTSYNGLVSVKISVRYLQLGQEEIKEGKRKGEVAKQKEKKKKCGFMFQVFLIKQKKIVDA